ncbi:ATP-dependent DNA ligase [Streptomyces indicus]|uniref:ATP dependent DNA ligase domain-containing protein n=1 Tax=Streptomyces indicus TaxID=417292 RepID=A0A1G8WJ66_9ACTN|nr:ATP-dependent DNA ligase [Streptomyces indicus]SDJ78167.1 ATP dependent DNA ligase domain-containing protein [Streptomyces indicus]
MRPPVKVALAESVSALPPAAGGWAYEPKFDGHRLVVFHVGGRVQLQARSGRIVTGSFPDITEAARALPEGTVVDGEVVVWTDGRIDFAAVQQRAMSTPARAAELARTLPASYAAFDLLSVRGEDLRAAPYTRRREELVALLAPLGPPLQAVPMTTDRELAESWYEGLRDTGIEGLVVKRLDQGYRAGRRSWLKLRHSDTRDAVVVGFTGAPARPQALVLVLPDDDTPVLSSPLGPGLRARAAELLPPAEGTGELNAVGLGDVTYRTVGGGLVVEVRQQATRHQTVGVVRFK